MRKVLAVVLLAAAAGGLLWWSPATEQRSTLVQLPAAPPPPPPRVVGAWSAPTTPAALTLAVAVTENGRPVAGAAVRVTREGQALGASTTDAQGLARLSLSPGPLEVSAEAHGAVVNRAVTMSALLGDVRLDLALEVGARIEVTVTDAATKQPLAGALVEVHVSSEEPRQVMVALRTDEAGHATAGGLVPNKYLLSVSREGYVSSRCLMVEAGSRARAVELKPYQPFSSRVLLPDGGPAAGATVTTAIVAWEEPATATTAPDGTFTLPYTASNNGRLCARLGELAGGGRLGDAIDGGLVLAPAGRLEGQVVRDEDDAPLEGVRVRTLDGSLEEVDTTRNDGRFSLRGLCEERAYATFERAGFVAEGELLSRGAPTTVRLSSPGAVRGQVVDDEGRGVAGAQVELQDPRALTVTDSDGRFGFERVKPRVQLRATEGQRHGSTNAAVEPGQLVEVTLSVGPVLMRVPVEVLLDGQLAGGVWTIEAKRLDGRPHEAKATWHARGRVADVILATAIRVPEGSFKVTATRNGREQRSGHGEAEFRVVRSEAPQPLRIHAAMDPLPPPKPTRPLRVQVLNSWGEPVADAGVNCIAEKWGSFRSGPDGRGVCAMEGELPIEVKTRVGGAVASAVPTDWPSEVVLRLQGGMTIRGQVVGDAGTPYSLQVNSKEELESFAFSTPDFVLEDRPSTRSILCVWSANEALGCTVVLPDPSGEVRATIPVGPPGAVRFTAADARGLTTPRPVVYVDRFSVRSGPDAGVVTLPLAPGQHVLIVNVAEGPERYETIVTVESGRTRDLGRLELK